MRSRSLFLQWEEMPVWHDVLVFRRMLMDKAHSLQQLPIEQINAIQQASSPSQQ